MGVDYRNYGFAPGLPPGRVQIKKLEKGGVLPF